MNVDINPRAVTPKDDHVIVELIAPPQETAGGLVIPDAAFNRPKYARVIAVGKGKQVVRVKAGKAYTAREDIGVSVGDVILYIGYEMLLSGNDRGKPQGGDTLIMKSDSIIGIVDGDDLPEYAR